LSIKLGNWPPGNLVVKAVNIPVTNPALRQVKKLSLFNSIIINKVANAISGSMGRPNIGII
jgi:hypothetical protein